MRTQFSIMSACGDRWILRIFCNALVRQSSTPSQLQKMHIILQVQTQVSETITLCGCKGGPAGHNARQHFSCCRGARPVLILSLPQGCLHRPLQRPL